MHARKWAYGALSAALGARAAPTIQTGPSWIMPDEGEPHTRTWMAFAWNASIWTRDLLPVVQGNLADVAVAIAQFEPVSMLVRTQEMRAAKKLLDGVQGVTLVEAVFDDMWVRDTGPVFVHRGGDTAGVDFNFNGWGDKQVHSKDALVAERICADAGVPVQHTALVLEGGALEVDGNGTGIITESCVLNDNRNPGWSKADVEAELKFLLGLDKIIWLPGVRGKDITDGHTDFYARFVAPAHVVAAYDPDPQSYDHAVTLTHLDILRNATDAHGRALNVTVLAAPEGRRADYVDDEDFAAGYVNFYVCNGGIVAPQFGDSQADADAYDTLARMYPDRKIVQVNIDGIAAGGGGIHCATQQEIVHTAGAGAAGAAGAAGVADAASGAASAAPASGSTTQTSGGGRRRGGKRAALAAALLGGMAL